jgi:cephalosporin hydroxylase
MKNPISRLHNIVNGGLRKAKLRFMGSNLDLAVEAQDFDEASYLWSVIVRRRPRQLIEIGRWLGGSTVLLSAAAATYGGNGSSVDLKLKAPAYADDKLIVELLSRLQLKNCELHVRDSRTFVPGKHMEFAFIDGDHSYAGVKTDFENLAKSLNRGADVLFHDSCASRPFATNHDSPTAYMTELK